MNGPDTPSLSAQVCVTVHCEGWSEKLWILRCSLQRKSDRGKPSLLTLRNFLCEVEGSVAPCASPAKSGEANLVTELYLSVASLPSPAPLPEHQHSELQRGQQGI